MKDIKRRSISMILAATLFFGMTFTNVYADDEIQEIPEETATVQEAVEEKNEPEQNGQEEQIEKIEEAVKAIEAGRKLAKTAIDKGAKYILPAEMGIGNTTSAAAMASVMLDMPPEKTTGRGTNIDDDKLTHKINIVRRAIEVNTVNPSDGIDVLSKL